MQLSELIGTAAVQEIEAAGMIRIHAVGDTGRPDVHNAYQEGIAEQMSADYRPDGGARNPALFLHLGDVIYGPRKQQLYRDEFYRPYMKYPGKIAAIPGNHDGEVFTDTDPVALRAFRDNFCAPTATVPPIADEVRIFRETLTLPGVYYLLRAPFLDVVALYSNIAEGPGSIIGENGDSSQKDWLQATLTAIAAERNAGSRRALMFAVHHPPFSNGGHSGSPQMLTDLDAVCTQAGLQPDAVISAHAHNYQRHTRRVQDKEIPFVVAGCGGHNDAGVDPAEGQIIGDRSFDKSFRGFGYLMISATQRRLQIQFIKLGARRAFDAAIVRLA